VAVWKEDNVNMIGKLTDVEFSKRYTYKRGRQINPNSLKAARNGTGEYIKRNAVEIIRNRESKRN